MGTILKPECTCGYESKNISFGAGMEDENVCQVPALQNGSSEIEMKNIRRREIYPEYIFYTENLMFESHGLVKTYDAWQYKLRAENNLCPSCKKYEMKFTYIGEFD